jgi:hypothetical protein
MQIIKETKRKGSLAPPTCHTRPDGLKFEQIIKRGRVGRRAQMAIIFTEKNHICTRRLVKRSTGSGRVIQTRRLSCFSQLS